MNICYAFIADEVVQRLGNNTALLLTTMGCTNLMLYALTTHSKTQLTRSQTISIELIVLIASIVYYFIPGGTQILLPDYSPYWTLPLFVYGMIVTQCLLVPTLMYGFRIYHDVKNAQIITKRYLIIKKRFLLLLIGLIFVEILVISSFLGNGHLIDKTIFTILSLFIFPAAILIYASVGRPLPQEEEVS